MVPQCADNSTAVYIHNLQHSTGSCEQHCSVQHCSVRYSAAAYHSTASRGIPWHRVASRAFRRIPWHP
eukprot:1854294-Prymnesium_polylepis.1